MSTDMTFERLPKVNYEQCVDACKADKRCSSFSFDKWNRYCFLKDTIPTEIRLEPSSIVAVMSGATPALSSAPRNSERFRNAAFYDQPYRQIHNSSYEKVVTAVASWTTGARCSHFLSRGTFAN